MISSSFILETYLRDNFTHNQWKRSEFKSYHGIVISKRKTYSTNATVTLCQRKIVCTIDGEYGYYYYEI